MNRKESEMNKILLGLCFALTAFISSQVYAVEIFKGKILQHKEWSTGQAKAVFKEVKNLNLKANLNNSSAMMTTSLADIVHGTVGIPVEVKGVSSGSIRNQTESVQTYYYNATVCAETNPFNTDCIYYNDKIELQPGGHLYIEGLQPSLSISFAEAGEHAIYVVTEIDDANGVSRTGSESISKAIIVLGK